MSKLVINIDSTSLGSSGCLRSFYLTVLGEVNEGVSSGGYREAVQGASLVYGIAVHKFIDLMYKTGNFKTAIDTAKTAFLSTPTSEPPKGKSYLCDPMHLTSVCYYVWEEHIKKEDSFELMELNGKPATEITFFLPYYEDDFCVVNLCGTIDRLGKIVNGCYCIRDWKTTSAWDNNGYFQQYELSRQLRMYTLALKLFSEKEPQSTLGKVGSNILGAAIDAIFLDAKVNETKVNSSIVYRYDAKELVKFRALLDKQIAKIVEAAKLGVLPLKEGVINGACMTVYGKCKFWNICATNDNVGRVLLKRDFKQWQHDPLNYNSIEI